MADLEAKNEIKNEVADLQTTQQSRKVSGVVLDTNNQPLVGATILQKGTSNGVITNLEGRFTIDLNGNAPVLEISYLGYVTETVKVGSRNTIKVILNEAAEQIDEVVVVGYGKSSVKRLTSAISTVKGDKLTNLPNTNLISSLEGRASGVFIQSAGGEPGALPTISIRGGGDPLYVIDGIPSSKAEFSVLSPSDIESFSILKDAAASAVYGARAGNGIVMVTTKKGSDGKVKITYNGSYAMSKPYRVH
ncbi:carboxypeptidase-like regulatory domain-containing protein [Bacteroides fragilis]